MSGTEDKARSVEVAMASALEKAMGSSFDRRRFLPYVMMHEFEAMLFSDCARFCLAVARSDLTVRLEKIRAAFETPEHIDDGRETAPSKRILNLLPSYEKPLMGNLGVLYIGLDRIRRECPHMRRWLELLEERGESQGRTRLR